MTREGLRLGLYTLWANLVLAFLLRSWTLERWLPVFFEEATPVRRAVDFWGSTGFDLNPHFFHYPALAFYLQFVVQASLIIFDVLTGAIGNLADARTAVVTDLPRFVLAGRWLTVAVDLGTIATTQVLLARLLTPSAGALGGFLLAINAFHVRHAQTVTVEPLLTLGLALASLATLAFMHRQSARKAIVMGVAIGLATACKYNGALFLLPVMGATLWYGWRTDGPRASFGMVAATGAAAILTFLILNPYILVSSGAFFSDFGYEVRHASEGHFGGAHLSYARSLWIAIGVFMLPAILLPLWVREPVTNILWLWVALYVGLVGAATLRFEHYLLPIVHTTVVLGVVGLYRSLPQLRIRTRVGAITAFAVLYAGQNAWALWDYQMTLQRPNPRIESRNWVDSHLDEGDFVVYEPYSLVEDGLIENPNFVRLPMSVLDPQTTELFYDPSWFEGFSHAAVSVQTMRRYVLEGTDDASLFDTQRRFYMELGSDWRRVATFGTGDRGIHVYENLTTVVDSELPSGLVQRALTAPHTTYTTTFLTRVATLQWSRGRPRRALSIVRLITQLQVRIPELEDVAHLLLQDFAIELVAEGRQAEGIKLLKHAVELAPKELELSYNLGIVLYRSGDPIGAADQWLRVVSLDPLHASAHYNLGVTFDEMGDRSAARRHFQATINADSNHTGARARLGLE